MTAHTLPVKVTVDTTDVGRARAEVATLAIDLDNLKTAADTALAALFSVDEAREQAATRAQSWRAAYVLLDGALEQLSHFGKSIADDRGDWIVRTVDDARVRARRTALGPVGGGSIPFAADTAAAEDATSSDEPKHPVHTSEDGPCGYCGDDAASCTFNYCPSCPEGCTAAGTPVDGGAG